jgi:uncharacterized protein (TIGR04222 family)
LPVHFRLLIGGMPGRGPPRQLDPYEVGYLAGGPQRVAEMIIAEQAACGAVRVDDGGTVRLADRATRTGPYADALDRIIWPAAPGGLTCYYACLQLKSDQAVAGIRRDLRGAGFMISAVRLGAWRLIGVALIAVMPTAGILHLIERPADPAAPYLLDLIALSAYASIWTAGFVFSGFTRTWLGRSYLNRVRESQPAPVALSRVAMAGLSAVPDQGLRDGLLAGMPAR